MSDITLEMIVDAVREVLSDAISRGVDYLQGVFTEIIYQDLDILIAIGLGGFGIVLLMAIIVMIFQGIGARTHKRRKGRAEPVVPQPETATQAPKNAPKTSTKKPSKQKAGGDMADKAAILADIESEMIALKELYTGGHISAEVYREESRTLYDRALALE